jgi:asparagine synthase (glutamine-hydrolysing)
LTLDGRSSLNWGLYPERFAELRDTIGGEPTLSAISLLELRSFIEERLLRDTDSTSMAVSLEVRVPFLDHEFLEAAARLRVPDRYLPLRRKFALRTMFGDRLPDSVFQRPKAGFELPLQSWCRNRLSGPIASVLNDAELVRSVGLNPPMVARLWRAFESGAPGLYWSRIWGLYVLLWWCRRHRIQA